MNQAVQACAGCGIIEVPLRFCDRESGRNESDVLDGPQRQSWRDTCPPRGGEQNVCVEENAVGVQREFGARCGIESGSIPKFFTAARAALYSATVAALFRRNSAFRAGEYRSAFETREAEDFRDEPRVAAFRRDLDLEVVSAICDLLKFRPLAERQSIAYRRRGASRKSSVSAPVYISLHRRASMKALFPADEPVAKIVQRGEPFIFRELRLRPSSRSCSLCPILCPPRPSDRRLSSATNGPSIEAAQGTTRVKPVVSVDLHRFRESFADTFNQLSHP